MKKILVASVLLAGILVGSSCDRVTNINPQTTSTTLDWSLYPGGDSLTYVQNNLWPSFTPNTNTLRNVLIEDFTGHQCVNCPDATANMEQLIATNPSRIYGVAIHAGATGLTSFQEVNADFPNHLYCDEGLEIGTFFGSIPGSDFFGNPKFCVNRVIANDQFMSNAGSAIANKTTNCLASGLKVNIQAASNYFASTRGLFLHTEVDQLDQSITSDLGIVVYVIEDSLIGRQTVQPEDDPDGGAGPNGTDPDGKHNTYIHRDIMRGCIDGRAFGRTLGTADLNANGKYYVNYSYRIPDELEVENMHLVIYVYDKITKEIYQTIKHEI
ncbi:MAG: Omp28-related outer membrane protein [Fluviicola sp.]|nr:Omp28-related outer membrane protein [Fluviicola sp.]